MFILWLVTKNFYILFFILFFITIGVSLLSRRCYRGIAIFEGSLLSKGYFFQRDASFWGSLISRGCYFRRVTTFRGLLLSVAKTGTYIIHVYVFLFSGSNKNSKESVFVLYRLIIYYCALFTVKELEAAVLYYSLSVAITWYHES